MLQSNNIIPLVDGCKRTNGRENLNKSQIDLSDKLTQKQNTSEKEIKSDLSKLNESLAVIVTAQKELNELTK